MNPARTILALSIVGLVLPAQAAPRKSTGRAMPYCETHEEICESFHNRRQCIIPAWIFADALDRKKLVPIWKDQESCVIVRWEWIET